jgi:hypothetical protein
MKKLLVAGLVAVVVVGLQGCSTTPVTAEGATVVPQSKIAKQFHAEEGKVRVTFLRDAGFFGSACDYDIKVNEELAFVLHPGERGDVFLPPGRHTLSASFQSFLCSQGLVSHTADLELGRPEVYRVVPVYGNVGMTKLK